MPEPSDAFCCSAQSTGRPLGSPLPAYFYGWFGRLCSSEGECGVYAPFFNYRFGLRLPDASSVLFTELYAIFSAVKYILRIGFVGSVVFSDSRAALVCIRDRFVDSSVPYIVLSIARLLLLASLRGLGVRLALVPDQFDYRELVFDPH